MSIPSKAVWITIASTFRVEKIAQLNGSNIRFEENGCVEADNIDINGLLLSDDSGLNEELTKAISKLGGLLTRDQKSGKIKLKAKPGYTFEINATDIQNLKNIKASSLNSDNKKSKDIKTSSQKIKFEINPSDIKNLMEAQASSQEEQERLKFLRAIASLQLDTVKAMLASNKQLTKSEFQNLTALDFACHINAIEIARLLIEYGAYIDLEDHESRTSLDRLKEKKHVQELKHLRQSILLSFAAVKENTEELKKLLNKYKSQLNTIFIYKGKPVTPLHFACSANAKQAVKILIEAGADITINTHIGKKVVNPLELLKDKTYAQSMRTLARSLPIANPSQAVAANNTADMKAHKEVKESKEALQDETRNTETRNAETQNVELRNLALRLQDLKWTIAKDEGELISDLCSEETIIRQIKFLGTVFTFTADKGELALLAHNAGTGKPGKLCVGVCDYQSNHIIWLAKFVKHEGYDFRVNLETLQKKPPKAKIEVLQTTPVSYYYEHPCFGISQNFEKIIKDDVFYYNCTASSSWHPYSDETFKFYEWSTTPTMAELKDLAEVRLNNMKSQVLGPVPTELMLTPVSNEPALEPAQTALKFVGYSYRFSADKGQLAIQGTGLATSQPGILKVGVRAPCSRQILKILEIEKKEGHDFYVNVSDLTSNPPNAKVDVYRTPVNYNASPMLSFRDNQEGIPKGIAYIGCNEQDIWHDSTVSVKRSHSPAKTR